MSTMKCPLCGSEEFIYKRDTGEYICKKCGCTISVMELKYYKPYPKEERVKAYRKYTDKFTAPVKTDEEEAYREIEILIRRFADHTPTREVDIKVAKDLLKRILKKRRWKKKYLAAALLIVAKKINNSIDASLSEYLKLIGSRSTINELKRTIKEVRKAANIRIFKNIDERMILSKFYSVYGYDDRVTDLISKIYKIIKARHLASGKKPETVYASIAYISYKLYGYPITIRKTAELVNITEVPIRNMIRSIMRNIHIIIDI
ncbi:MAG TPA: transcription initiation factor IIB family protein [Thermoprotei archaeon]|nr:transcription initiation factor IIB family protein [Thermoprotei archaeon]